MEALRFDPRWKVALDLPIDHPGFHATSLVKFRARLLLHGKERIVFERSLALATELRLLEGSVEQIVDSTPMLGAAPRQKPPADWHDKTAREAMLVDVATDAQRALRAVEQHSELMAEDTIGGLLGEIVGQEFEHAEDDNGNEEGTAAPSRPPAAADHLRARSRDAPWPQDQRAPLHRLQAAHRGRRADAGAHRGHGLAR
jgi:hypothetical protein